MKSSFRPFALLVLAACGLTACSDDSAGHAPCLGEVYCGDPAECETTALFVPVDEVLDEIRTFPTDLFTAEDQTTETGLRLNLQKFGYRNEVNHLDGFGTFAPVVVAFDEHLDETLIHNPDGQWDHPGSPVFLMRADGLSTSDGSDFASRLVPLYLSYQYDDRVLFMTPEVPLQPATRYAVVVTGCMPGASGGGSCGSDAFRALRNRCPDDFPRTYCDQIHEILDYLEQPTICLYRENIAVALSFTTRSTTSYLEAVRDWVRAQDPPQPTITHVMDTSDGSGNFNPDLLTLYPGFVDVMQGVDLTPYALDSAGQLVMGTFESHRFYDPDTGLPGRNPQTGEPEPVGQEQLEFLIVVPPNVPAGGAPVVIFQHAFTVCKETMAALAGTFGKAGLAMAGIDLTEHGSRSEAGSGSCEIEPMSFISLARWNVVTARLEQSVADLLQFSHMVKHLDLDVAPADGLPDLDPTRLGLVGQSLGAFMSGVFGALDRDIQATVINVGGAGLTYFFIAVAFQDYLSRPDYANLPQGFWEMFLAFQMVNEGCDPANYVDWYLPDGPHGPRNLLIQEAFEDDIVPNYSTELLARLVGAPHVAPDGLPAPGLSEAVAPLQGNWLEGRTAGMYRYQPAEHDFLLKDHPQDNPGITFRGQIQTAVFLLSALTTGSGIIIDPSDPAQVAQHAPFWDLPPP